MLLAWVASRTALRRALLLTVLLALSWSVLTSLRWLTVLLLARRSTVLTTLRWATVSLLGWATVTTAWRTTIAAWGRVGLLILGVVREVDSAKEKLDDP